MGIHFAVRSSGFKSWIKTYQLRVPVSWPTLVLLSHLPVMVIRPTLQMGRLLKSLNETSLERACSVPRHGKASEDSDFKFDITEALHGSILCQREGWREKIMSTGIGKCLTSSLTACEGQREGSLPQTSTTSSPRAPAGLADFCILYTLKVSKHSRNTGW